MTVPGVSVPIVVMGVSGVGKTSVGRAVSKTLGARFVDADDLHPPANKAKMAAGLPLDDDDRLPWLEKVGQELTSVPVVVACSALRRYHRDLLRSAAPDTVFVHLAADADVLRIRVTERIHEYMPPGLLDSQLATLEQLQADERGFAVDAAAPLDRVVVDALTGLDNWSRAA